MKKIIYVLAVAVVVVGSLLLFGAKPLRQFSNNSDDVKVENRQSLKDSLFEYHAEWDMFIYESEQTIKSNEIKITSFKEKLEESGPKDLLQFGKIASVLEEKNLALKSKLERYRNAQETGRIKFRNNFTRDSDLLEKKITHVINDNRK